MNRSITVGIPAYNEENNISKLVNKILTQNIKDGIVKEIIIISDGSTDKTNEILRSYKQKNMIVIIHKNRNGLMSIQNEIAKKSTGEILVLLDADVLPKNNNFIEEIIKPIVKDENVGIVGGNTESLDGKNLFEKIIAESHKYKMNIYLDLSNKNNIYLCHGRARAFSKKYYKKIHWPNNAPEDSYSYLDCLRNNFKFIYSRSATVLFKSPDILNDHKKQSDRFFNGNEQLKDIFGEKLVIDELFIPTSIKLKKTIKYLFVSPILISLYFILYFYLSKFSKKYIQSIYKWDIAKSSKKLN